VEFAAKLCFVVETYYHKEGIKWITSNATVGHKLG
jgi:hypothetical protein